MRRKIMIVAWVLVLIFTLIISLTNCNATDDKRFKRVYSEPDRRIYVDTETGVQYLYVTGGVTVLVDAEGKPLIWEDNEKDN